MQVISGDTQCLAWRAGQRWRSSAQTPYKKPLWEITWFSSTGWKQKSSKITQNVLFDHHMAPNDIIRFSNFSPSIPHSPGPTASECGWWGWPCLLVFGGSTIALLLQTHLNVSSLFKDYTVITSKSARLSVIEGARSWNLVKFSSSNVRLVKEVSEWAVMSVLQSRNGLLQKTILRLKNRYTSSICLEPIFHLAINFTL